MKRLLKGPFNVLYVYDTYYILYVTQISVIHSDQHLSLRFIFIPNVSQMIDLSDKVFECPAVFWNAIDMCLRITLLLARHCCWFPFMRYADAIIYNLDRNMF